MDMDHQQGIALCMQHMHRYVGIQTADGAYHDGIIEKVDETHVYLAVPIGCESDSRAFFPGPFGGYPAFGYGFPYGYGFWPRRRFYRTVLPLAALLSLSLLPYY
ncbi:hypothetical protein ACFFK0_06330 [Paenibacillus chartarius]|uniref:Phosphatidylinositol kinase n=1 Tax=Paenibacillus chartarius TaxID=747481 RepID=A0ABV6DHF4_9BACL